MRAKSTKLKLNDLPVLPFEKILSYLSLKDRIRSRAVSRRWYHAINKFRTKSLSFSEHPIERTHPKSRWVNGAFDQNFIHSSKFDLFFQTFSQTILSSLKHLRLFGLDHREDKLAFVQILNSFGQLEQLAIYRVCFLCSPYSSGQFELNLPLLTSLQMEAVNGFTKWGIIKLTLKAPRLRKLKLVHCGGLNLDLVHPESVEKLSTDRLQIGTKKLKI